jgi:hypothetical protein
MIMVANIYSLDFSLVCMTTRLVIEQAIEMGGGLIIGLMVFTLEFPWGYAFFLLEKFTLLFPKGLIEATGAIKSFN